MSWASGATARATVRPKGISEQSDAIAVVVSEETGAISLMNDGRMVSYLNEARLRNMLAGLLKVSLEENGK